MAALAKLAMPRRIKISATYLEERNKCILTPLALRNQTLDALARSSGRHANSDFRIYKRADSKQGKSEDSSQIAQIAAIPKIQPCASYAHFGLLRVRSGTGVAAPIALALE